MFPLALVLRRRSPLTAPSAFPTSHAPSWSRRPLGMAPAALQTVLIIAGLSCCVAMSMPQVHIVAYSGDLGHGAASGAKMLSLMLGFGIVSRLASGWICDRIGGRGALLRGASRPAPAPGLFPACDGPPPAFIGSGLVRLLPGGTGPASPLFIRG